MNHRIDLADAVTHLALASLALLVGHAALAAAPSLASPSLSQREAAARQTAESNPLCQAIRPFYWSIGDAHTVRVDGREGLGAPRAETRMAIASASKLIYGAYVAEKRHGALTAEDVSFLHFTSGYTPFDHCLKDQTVAECQSYQSRRIHNGGYVPENDGRFYYSGGHMQKHATLIGLGPDDNDALARDINTALGGTAFEYNQPQLPGGVRTSAAEYGRLLQRVVGGSLKIGPLLGHDAVCTNPDTCPTAVYTPIPRNESWHYAIGHWVEDDPNVGDGAFSSPGAFGFYPWVDAGKHWWGIVARESFVGLRSGHSGDRPALQSVYCGREIRAAWLSGQPR